MIAKAEGPRGEGESELRRATQAQAKAFSEATLVHSVTVFGEALKNAKLLGESRLFAETALARLAGHRDMRFLDQMVRELQALERRVGGGPAGPPASAAATVVTPAPAAPPRPTAAVQPPVVPPARAPELAAQVSEAPSPAAPTVSSDLTIDVVRGRWNDVLEAARSNSKLRAALAVASVMELQGGTLVLAMDPGSGFHRAALSAGESREPLAALFERTLGRRLAVETVERAKDPSAPAAADEPARRPAEMGERLTAAERAAAEQAPITRLVEKELKARIVHMERQD
jgi:hypothetical protein